MCLNGPSSPEGHCAGTHREELRGRYCTRNNLRQVLCSLVSGRLTQCASAPCHSLCLSRPLTLTVTLCVCSTHHTVETGIRISLSLQTCSLLSGYQGWQDLLFLRRGRAPGYTVGESGGSHGFWGYGDCHAGETQTDLD